MDIVLNNPFRVLGLPATATTRDITKRISDLETFAELGKTKTFPNDFSVLGSIDRSLESIKDAARKIEQTEGRLFHSFFWFRQGDSVDELALESLAAGNIEEALDIWSKQLGKKGTKKYTWRLNRCVLHLVNANAQNLDKYEMNEALEDLGFVIDDHLVDSIEDVLSGSDSGLDSDRLWRHIVDELISRIQSSSGTPYGKKSVLLADSFWAFPVEAREYATSKIINPLIEEVNDAIKRSEALRSDENLDSLKVKNFLDKVEPVIRDLEAVLGDDDSRFQTIANAYADEVCDCAVQALNKFKNPKLAFSLAKWSQTLPAFSRVKSRIEENFEIIQGWVEEEEDDEIYGALVKKIKVEIYSLTQASTMLESMMAELQQIKAAVGATNKSYIKASSACANRILGFLIDTVNTAQDSFKVKKNLSDLQLAVSSATALTRKLLILDLDSATRERVTDNLETIVGISKTVNIASTVRANRTSNSDGYFNKIPEWLWIIGALFLLSMCSG